jgi:membrane fusion protein (multidrug efflux system)
VLSLLLALPGCSGDKDAKTAKEQEATPMKVMKAETREMPNWGEFVGQINAVETVDIRARVAGFLLQKNFKEGATVAKGDLLFLIDPKPFNEDLKQAQSGLEYNLALADKAQKDYERFKKLYDEGVVSRDEFEGYQTNLNTLKAQISDNRAQVENAKIQLGYTKIYSPIDGVIGKVQVDVGNLVGQGETTLLATLSTVDPVYVNFSVSESDYIRAVRDQYAKESRNSAIKMILADGSEYDHEGRYDMVDRAVDPGTGTLGIRVTFPNPEHILRPGQYAKIRVLLEMIKDAVVIPARGVIDTQGMKSLFVVDDTGEVRSQPVTLGFEVKGVVVITKGLKAGDMVIIDGIRRAKAGMKIKPIVVPMAKPEGQPVPTGQPEDDTSGSQNATRPTPDIQPDSGGQPDTPDQNSTTAVQAG